MTDWLDDPIDFCPCSECKGDRRMITPEDAAMLLGQMLDAAMNALDADAAGEQLSDEQYSAVRADLDQALAEILAHRLEIRS